MYQASVFLLDTYQESTNEGWTDATSSDSNNPTQKLSFNASRNTAVLFFFDQYKINRLLFRPPNHSPGLFLRPLDGHRGAGWGWQLFICMMDGHCPWWCWTRFHWLIETIAEAGCGSRHPSDGFLKGILRFRDGGTHPARAECPGGIVCCVFRKNLLKSKSGVAAA